MLLTPYLRAAFPLVAVETTEEGRFVKTLVDSVSKTKQSVYTIAQIGGLKDAKSGAIPDPTATFQKAIQFACQKQDTVLVIFDIQHIVHNAPIYRTIKDAMSVLKSKGSTLIFVAPHWKLPEELKTDIPVLEFGLPTREELNGALQAVSNSIKKQVPEDMRPALLDAAAGLALEQGENAFSLAYIDRGNFDADRVAEEKMRMVRTSGLMEVWRPINPATIGGMGLLKEYLSQEVVPFKDDPELRIRGILEVGVPGTGKSLFLKAAGAYLGWPVLRLDVASLKGSLVGQSEANMKKALQLASAVAPCVLGLDELEKGVGGYASSAVTDSGVTLGMVGQLLTWMQENTSPVLVVGTCNDFGKLPVELVRRFDEVWFLDLPNLPERREIAEVHLLAVKCKYNAATLDAVANHTSGFTGSEIRKLVLSLARQGKRAPAVELVETLAQTVKPISQSRSEEIAALRQRAETSMRIANSPEPEPTTTRRLKRTPAGE